MGISNHRHIQSVSKVIVTTNRACYSGILYTKKGLTNANSRYNNQFRNDKNHLPKLPGTREKEGFFDLKKRHKNDFND